MDEDRSNDCTKPAVASDIASLAYETSDMQGTLVTEAPGQQTEIPNRAGTEHDTAHCFSWPELLKELKRSLYQPEILVFLSVLNRYLPPVGRQRQKKLAAGLGIVTSALSHYRAGRRIPPLDTVRAIARELGLSLDEEDELISAWFFDHDIYSLRSYFDSIIRDEAYDRLPLVLKRLNQLRMTYLSARR